MTSSFPRRLAAWLGVRVANRKKVRWQSMATDESGGLSPFRGHSSVLNARRHAIVAGSSSPVETQFTVRNCGTWDARAGARPLGPGINPALAGRRRLRNIGAFEDWA